MGERIQSIRGMNDILPQETPYWRDLENRLIQQAQNYGYREIRLPILEKTQLFARSIGEVTDIVEKEMYTFVDRNGDSLTLRPEGTAGCVRAAIEHGLVQRQQQQRLWYLGPLFRHERPQKGRYRQFYQFGVEAFGFTGPAIDIEQIALTARIWKQLGLFDTVTLKLNTLGSSESRRRYRQRLVDYFEPYYNEMDPDSQRRLKTNPLRILDSKHPKMQTLIQQAPKLIDELDATSKTYFDTICQQLDRLGIPYEIDPYVVRGLDYYCHTVFEWVSSELGAQSAVCAGGHYDSLVEQLGGDATPAVGFAIGLERLVALLQSRQTIEETPHAYFIQVGDQAQHKGFQLSEQLRDHLPKLSLMNHCGGGSFKRQFKRANKSGARWALILGDEEIEQNKISLKDLREGGEQRMFDFSELVEFLKTKIEV